MALTRGYKLLQKLREVQAHDGQLYVVDCHPWAIKPGCERLDCPMRALAVAPEAKEGAAQFNCEPAGELADLLITLQRTQGE